MTEAEITQKIKEIKQLIVDRRFRKAFLILADIIEEIDRLDQDDVDDVELENQMHLIRSRFNTYHSKAIEGTPTDNAEFNQITLSILEFLDQVKKIAIEYKSNQSTSVSTNLSANNPPETIAHNVLTPSLEERGGCLVAFNNKDTNVKVQMKNFSPTRLILSIAGLLVALGFFIFMMRGCDGCSKTIIPGPPSIVDTTINIPEQPAPFGPDGEKMNLESESAEYAIADYLSDPKSTFPKNFPLEGVEFGKNAAVLNQASKRNLDNLVAVLKEYQTSRFEIFGHLQEDENGSYQGSKELSLDDVRARSIYDYLKSRGIEEYRMNFMGDGTNPNHKASILLRGRK